MKIEILILSLLDRAEKLERLLSSFKGYQDEVSIQVNLDNGEKTIGQKRNELLQAATADYVCFFDDDDLPSGDYLKWLVMAADSGCDCASLIGSIFINNIWSTFIHSIDYKSWYEANGVYYRPPNHLNLIKREIAQQFKFPEINTGEDHAWSQQICDSGILKTEFKIPATIYYYTPSANQ